MIVPLTKAILKRNFARAAIVCLTFLASVAGTRTQRLREIAP